MKERIKKKIRKAILLYICAVLVFPLRVSELALSVTAKSKEHKAYCNATMEEEFADDRILVVLSNKASLENLETGNVDFSEIKPKGARNLTSNHGQRVKTMVAERKKASLIERAFTSDPNANEVAEYHQVVC